MLAAGGAVIACGPPAAQQKPTAESKPAAPAAGATAAPAAKPTEAPKPAATIAVSGAAPTAAPTAAPAAAPAAAKYKEAPQLADLVKAGKLPPVDQRLPASPRVLKPLEEAGQYGGTWRRAYRGISDRWGPTKLLEEHTIEWDAPDPNTIRVTANVVEKWEQSADATEFTFYLRKGMKWSDGTEITTDDTKFWWEDIEGNKEIRPAPSFAVRQRIGEEYKTATLTIIDKYSFKVKYAAPYPLLPLLIAKSGGGMPGSAAFFAPSHYLKKFHPKYAKVEDLNKLATDRKLTAWVDLWGKAGDLQGPVAFWFLNPELPVLNPWKIITPAPADPMVMERNPFYWHVDANGNQLPYIDRVEHSFFENDDVLNLWVASGRIDMQMRHMSAGSYTFYKENEKKGNYRVFRWRAASTDAYFPNINAPDKELAKLFDTADFRQALSIAINRAEVNELVWNGLGKPRQASPVKGSPEYDAEMEQKWAEYDPKKANELLDKLGLTKGPDGIRKRPDGKPLEVTITHSSNPGDRSLDAHELIKKYWNAIGVRTNTRYVERTLYEQLVHNGEIEIGYWGFDRCSVVKADPGRWLGTIDDGPWAPNYGHWYAQNAYKKEEPPQDHPIREIWRLWEKTQQEPDEAKRNATFQEIINIHKKHPYAIGVVGEKVAPMIVTNAFRNVLDGFIADDTLRDSGLLNPQQFFIKK
jgi:peptide/nickel transport system substrate-binding protein